MQDRDAFSGVSAALRAPNLPENGGLLQSYVPVEEAAHSVGRVLHEIGSPTLTDAVLAEGQAEIDAVECAERGELAGRTEQAAVLTRADASPIHIAAANVLLDSSPFGSPGLFRDVDPTSASVAAAYWLSSAATVAADVSGLTPARVVEVADDIEATPTEAPTEVLVRICEGETPLAVVLDMIGSAMAVADGRIPNLAHFGDVLEEAEEMVSRYGIKPTELDVRLVSLDLARPAPDLLEDLVAGIYACFLVWSESAPDEDEGELVEGEIGTKMDARQERREAVFVEAVRLIATAGQRRIGL